MRPYSVALEEGPSQSPQNTLHLMHIFFLRAPFGHVQTNSNRWEPDCMSIDCNQWLVTRTAFASPWVSAASSRNIPKFASMLPLYVFGMSLIACNFILQLSETIFGIRFFWCKHLSWASTALNIVGFFFISF